VPEVELEGTRHESVPCGPEAISWADCVVMLTPHREFADPALWEQAKLVVDTRNVVPPGPNVHSI
jgi:UDP-N-acetyl-D-mannosaminuronate dehydrogenase